ncbi:MAG: MFS transporter [Deltaproteobacteria bacterium]|nr:MFS transporter [Deltaproteobacteria bacterium]MBN2674126.1 MFS transporter [Deltaproteobacteria bacterium]
MSLQFFFIIGVFWILKPLKKALFIQQYDSQPFTFFHWSMSAAQTELLAKNMNLLAAFAAMVFFIALAKRFTRHVLLTIASVLSIAGAVILSIWLQTETAASVWALYIFGDLFNMFMLAAFFAFLNDSVSAHQAKRLFGFIIFGGVLGGAVGSSLTRGLISHLQMHYWFAICIGMITAVIALAWASAKQLCHINHPSRLSQESADKKIDTASCREDHSTESKTSGTPGIRQLLRSRYIMSIAAIVASYEIVSSIIDFQFSAAVSHFLDGPAIGAYFSTVYMMVNIVSLSIQLFATGLVMRKLGVTHALLFLPISLLLGSVSFLIAPILLVGALLCIFDNGLNYSMNQSAKESLYIPVHASRKYNAKAIIDIFTQRSAKAVGVNLTLLLSAVLSFRWLAAMSVCIIVFWIASAVYAGRRFDTLTDNHSDDGPPKWEKSEKNNPRVPRKMRLFPITHLKL